jgi:hypothetical protein
LPIILPGNDMRKVYFDVVQNAPAYARAQPVLPELDQPVSLRIESNPRRHERRSTGLDGFCDTYRETAA